jgi:hypothetical protein
MSKYYTGARAKKDANQKEIERSLSQVGASCLDMSRLKNCFDLLVGFRGQTYIMEIKNPEYVAKSREPIEYLSDGEREFMESWRGSAYHIVTTSEEALRIIGAIE